MTREQEALLDEIVIGDWKIRDGLVDVQGSVFARDLFLKDLEGIRFGRVSNNVNFRNNMLKTMLGMPRKVGGDFIVAHNILKNLEHGPEIITGEMNVSGNPLDSLAGAPMEIGSLFYADELGVENWSPKGWVQAWQEASPMGRNLLMDVLSPKLLNPLIQKDPKSMVELLSPIWHDDDFDEIRDMLKFPAEYGNVDDLMNLLQKARDLEGFL